MIANSFLPPKYKNLRSFHDLHSLKKKTEMIKACSL